MIKRFLHCQTSLYCDLRRSLMMIQRRSASNVFNVWEIFAKWNFTSIFQMILTPIRWPLWFERIFQPQNPISDRIFFYLSWAEKKKLITHWTRLNLQTNLKCLHKTNLKNVLVLSSAFIVAEYGGSSHDQTREREKARDVFSQSFEECAIMTWWWAEKLNWISFLWPNWILSLVLKWSMN